MPQQASKKGARRQYPPGIRDIAESLGVSIGTVDRALHNRPGINQKTRTRILEQAKAMGYRPNLAARFLSSRKQLRVGVNLPSEIASFFDLVRDGILEAVRAVETSDVKLVHRSYPGLGNGEKEALAEALETDLDGLIMVPGQPVSLVPLLRKAAERRLPVVCVNTDAPQVEHLATVCVDSLTTGALVGELMGRFIASKGQVMVVTGQLSTIDHAQKVAGIPPGPGRDVARAPDRRGGRGPRPRAGGLREVPEAARLDDRHRGCLRHDRQLHPGDAGRRGGGPGRPRHRHHLGPFPGPGAGIIESGRVAATLYQRPVMQGQLAFRALYSYLVEGVRPSPVTRLAPHVVMKSNLKLFMDQLPRRATDGSRRRKLEGGEPMSGEDSVTA